VDGSGIRRWFGSDPNFVEGVRAVKFPLKRKAKETRDWNESSDSANASKARDRDVRRLRQSLKAKEGPLGIKERCIRRISGYATS